MTDCWQLQGVPVRVLRYVLSVDAKQKVPKAGAAANQAVPAAVAVVKPMSKASAVSTIAKKAEVIVAQTPAVAKSSALKSALKIISEESGVAEEELTDDTVFSDIGIDSLLSLVITSRFREELNIELELEEFFIRYATVKDLKQFFFSAGSPAPVAPQALEVKMPLPEILELPKIHDLEGIVPPSFHDALTIISEESGISVDDLTDDCVFSDIGIDSLLSLVIVSRYREELGVNIEMDSVFTNFPTVAHLKRLFASASGETSATVSIQLDSLDDEHQGTQSASSETSASEQDPCPTPDLRPVPPATSVLLQGLPKNAKHTLFLFPDGAGSATSYSGIPRIASDVALVGLNSPYYRKPADFKCNIDDLIDSYVAEVRRRQPSGPYHMGGWSAGGILAYHATQKLIDSGEVVQHLLLIDSPAPKGLDKLPQHFYDFCSEHQLFGHATNAGPRAPAPEWLIPHFNATINVLHDYLASPLPVGKTPEVSLIWACESIVDGKNVPKLPPHPDDTEGMKFLTERRTDFSGNGWERLFPVEQLRIERADGANHFTMVVSLPQAHPRLN